MGTIVNKEEVSKESGMWIVSLACAQILLENQHELEHTNKYKQKLKQASKLFISEVEKAISPDIEAIFDECEGTSQEIIKGIELLAKVASKMNPANLDKVINFIEELW